MSSPQNNILKGSMAQAQNKNKKNPTHEKPVEWSFSIFIFLELLAFKLLDGG
jgi:heme/copper-type cytochrome/quinol oxidase subunit 3